MKRKGEGDGRREKRREGWRKGARTHTHTHTHTLRRRGEYKEKFDFQYFSVSPMS